MSQTYKYLFGPVASRRLGVSLGIDVVPHKTCSLNCVYCECGTTTNLTVVRQEYFPTQDIVDELQSYLHTSPQLDALTFSGAGEPTLHAGFGEIVGFIKQSYPQYKLVLLTNSTLLDQPDVMEAVQKIDLIIPSLDAASELVFKKLNRPHRTLTAETMIRQLAYLKQHAPVEMWLEIFIVPGLNDTADELALLKQAVDKIQPDRVQINSLDRPPTAQWVKQATPEKLREIARQFSDRAEVIARFSSAMKVKADNHALADAIVQLIKRRPCTIDDLVSTLGHPQSDIEYELKMLMLHKQVQQEQLDRGVFYRIVEDFQ
ncbi:radical SAM protein [candidate division KSB1 bacterium]|nr:radical SAM protein [candidate division KSB1 bacterium]